MTANPIVVDCSAAPTGATISVSFVTDTATWGVKGYGRSSYGEGNWFIPRNVNQENNGKWSGWALPSGDELLWADPQFSNTSAQWLVPGLSTWIPRVNTTAPYLFARAVQLDENVLTDSVTVHVNYLVDDFLSAVSVSQDSSVTPSATKSLTDISGDTQQRWKTVVSQDPNPSGWASGLNYLLFQIENNGDELSAGTSGDRSGGPFGFAAHVTISATCQDTSAVPDPISVTPADTAFTLTCTQDNTFSGTFVTNYETWAMKGATPTSRGGGAWFRPYDVKQDPNNRSPGGWTNLPPEQQWDDDESLQAQWLIPGLTAWGIPYIDTSSPYILTRAINIPSGAILDSINVHVDFTVDDWLNAIWVTKNADVVPNLQMAGENLATNDRPWKIISNINPTISGWQEGTNYLIFQFQNNGAYFSDGSDIQTYPGGAFGFAAHVTIEGQCQAPTPASELCPTGSKLLFLSSDAGTATGSNTLNAYNRFVDAVGADNVIDGRRCLSASGCLNYPTVAYDTDKYNGGTLFTDDLCAVVVVTQTTPMTAAKKAALDQHMKVRNLPFIVLSDGCSDGCQTDSNIQPFISTINSLTTPQGGGQGWNVEKSPWYRSHDANGNAAASSFQINTGDATSISGLPASIAGNSYAAFTCIPEKNILYRPDPTATAENGNNIGATAGANEALALVVPYSKTAESGAHSCVIAAGDVSIYQPNHNDAQGAAVTSALLALAKSSSAGCGLAESGTNVCNTPDDGASITSAGADPLGADPLKDADGNSLPDSSKPQLTPYEESTA